MGCLVYTFFHPLIQQVFMGPLLCAKHYSIGEISGNKIEKVVAFLSVREID